MRKHKSITWRVSCYLLVFMVALLSLIWLSQAILLPTFYQAYRENSVAKLVTELGNSLGSPQFSGSLSQISREQSACIRVLRQSGTEIYSMDCMPYSDLSNYSKSDLKSLWSEANNSRGCLTKIYSMDSLRLKRLVPTGVDAIVYMQVFYPEGQEPTAIYYNSTITPIDGMMDVLKLELWWIMIFAVICTAGLAFILSRHIARPITKINERAKLLKLQDYSVVFEIDNYQEVAELSETLTATGREMALLDGLRRELIANVSHDLRTPLSMIIAFAEVMRDIPGENTKENAQIVIEEAARLSELVDNVLLFPQPAEITDALNCSFYDFALACRSTIERYQKLSINKACHIAYDGPEHVQVRADRVKLSQVIYNLLNNAIAHAGDSPDILLRIETLSGKITVLIIDHGEGIPNEKLPLIWERYYSDTSDEQFHAGLGLTIVRHILELHHAEYGVASTLGEGSTFWFSLDCYEGSQQ